MGKIGQNPKIGQLWRPVAPQPYVMQKSWPISETHWPLDTTWSKQYLSAVHPVTCSLLWVRWLLDRLSSSDFVGKWPPKMKIIEAVLPNSSTGYQITFCDQIWWKSAVAKLPKGRVDYHTQKTRAPRDSSQALFCPKWADRDKIHWTLSPLDMFTYTEFGLNRLRFAGLIQERLIFRPQKSIQYRLSAYNKRLCSRYYTKHRAASLQQQSYLLSLRSICAYHIVTFWLRFSLVFFLREFVRIIEVIKKRTNACLLDSQFHINSVLQRNVLTRMMMVTSRIIIITSSWRSIVVGRPYL